MFDAEAGENSGADGDVKHTQSIAGESKSKIPRNTTEERFATWTESLGFESFNERVASGDIPEENVEEEEGRNVSPTAGVAGMESESRSRKILRRKSSKVIDVRDDFPFPPLLSTLNENGRPGFDFIKKRENGRLQLKMVPSDRLEVVAIQTPPMRQDKRLKMLLVKPDAADQNQNQNQNQDQDQAADDQNKICDDHDDDNIQDQSKEGERSQSNIGDPAGPDTDQA